MTAGGRCFFERLFLGREISRRRIHLPYVRVKELGSELLLNHFCAWLRVFPGDWCHVLCCVAGMLG